MPTKLLQAQVGLELPSAWATAVAPTAKIMYLKSAPTFDDDSGITKIPNQGTFDGDDAALVRQAAKIAMDAFATYEDNDLYFKQICGGVAPTGTNPYTRTSVGPSTVKPGVVSHTFKGGNAGDVYQLPGGILGDVEFSGGIDGDGLWSVKSNWMAQKTPPVSGVNEVQTVTIGGVPTGGTMAWGFQGYQTTALAFDATGATVQTAMRLLASINGANITVAGSAGGPYTVTFIGNLANMDVELVVIDISLLTGGTPTQTVVESTRGGGLTSLADRALEIIRMADTKLYIDAAGATIGATELATSLIDFSFKATTGRHLKMLGGSLYPSDHGYNSIGGGVDVTVENTAAVKTLVDVMKNGSVKKALLRIEAISGSKGMRLDRAVVLAPIPSWGDRSGNKTRKLKFEIVRDVTAGVGLGFRSVNAVATLPF